MKITVGSRGSKLALAQTEYVINRLKQTFNNFDFEIKVIKTTGDIEQTRPLDTIGSKGIFVEEIENQLLSGHIQMAVHSLKDMPDEIPQGLIFADPWEREDPRDVLILNQGSSLDDIPTGGIVATGSKRRSFQLLRIRPDIKIVPIRGNIDTRIRKLSDGLDDGTRLDAIIIAAAGLHRLGLKNKISYYFPIEQMIPTPGQGRLAIELCENNKELLEAINTFSDTDSRNITELERGFLKAIGGDCHLPIGAYATKLDDQFVLKTMFGNSDGSKLAFSEVKGQAANQQLIDLAVNELKEKLGI